MFFFIFLTALPTIVQGVAIRYSVEKRTDPGIDDSIWTNSNLDAGSNKVRVAMSTKKVNWGATSPWKALDTLHQHCHRTFSNHLCFLIRQT
jgi:hypothetical protein